MQNIAVIFGGRSGEYEVSMKSAAAIVKNLDHKKYHIFPIAITKDGRWWGPVAENDVANFKSENYIDYEIFPQATPGGYLRDFSGNVVMKLDAVIPIIHGTYGEDGILQGLLELMDIPYVGAGVLGSAVGMDKITMRKVLAYHNIPQVGFVALNRKDLEEQLDVVVAELEAKLPYPIFIKPSNAGSSVGVSKADNREMLIAGLIEAAKFDSRILAEEGLDVREIEISVMGNETPLCSCAGEIVASNDFYDYNAKYIDNKSVAHIPADLTWEEKETIEQLAKEAYIALACEGLGRMDFFINRKNGKIYLNEINTLPGFTEISMYSKLWQAVGVDMKQLLDQLLEYASKRYQERKRNIIDF